ncbi:hypothetical protein [Nitrospira sp. BLG_1]|uniref:hypothetical protein n=1 Tax=Nitrospira sp. BLG_1 TaxID=3395883 RepID=UPI0039BC3EFD
MRDVTNEQIAKWLGWIGLKEQEFESPHGYRPETPRYTTDVALALSEVAPEIERRGYRWALEGCSAYGLVVRLYRFGDFDVHLVQSWPCTDPPSIAAALCEALVTTEGRE